MIARRHNNKIEIKFQYNPLLISRIKTLENREYNAGTKSWFIPLVNSGYSIKQLAMWGFKIEDELSEAVKVDEQMIREAEAMTVMSDIEFTSPLPLFPFQRVGAAFLYKVGSGILGDQPGLGKTLMAMAVAEKARARKVLIFCPAVLKYQWAGEIEKFMGKEKVIVIEGVAGSRASQWQGDARFYIANYELLLRDLGFITKTQWDYIIADECTKVSNPRAKMSKAIKKIPATHRIAMSGTLISNKAEDVWNILDFINPGSAGNYWNFLNRYCIKDRFGGIARYQNMDELRKKLSRYMIRRLKDDVLPDLPDKIETDMPFVLSDEEKELQNKIKKELLFDINKADVSKIESLPNLQYTIAKFQRLRMLADSLELLGENTKSTKLEVLKELLSEFQDEKIIIFSEFAGMCKILHREIPRSVMIIGETSDKKRVEVVNKFNEDDLVKVLVMSSAGQFGLNLYVASVVINYDLPFSLAKLEQRIGRAHRYGQKNKVFVYNLIGKGTADRAIQTIIHAKSKLSGQILGDVPLTMEDLRQMITYEG